MAAWGSGAGALSLSISAEVRESVITGLPETDVLPVIPLGTALGVHGGPGCVVVAVQELDALPGAATIGN